jgi:hypothetical protein
VEVAFSAGSNVRFAIIRGRDRRHRLCKVVPHLDVLFEYVVPSCPVELDDMALGVTDLSDDVSSRHPARLSTIADAPPYEPTRRMYLDRPQIRTRSAMPPAAMGTASASPMLFVCEGG